MAERRPSIISLPRGEYGKRIVEIRSDVDLARRTLDGKAFADQNDQQRRALALKFLGEARADIVALEHEIVRSCITESGADS